MTDAKTAASGVLIAGVSTRALAVSAARSGYRVTAVDAFGDLDLREAGNVITLQGDHGVQFSPGKAVSAVEAIVAGMVAYTSNFENHPEAVSRLARRRKLLGNPSAVLIRVRDPINLMRVLRRQGFATPETRATPMRGQPTPGSWLLKPRRSGGGHGTVVWQIGQPVPRTHYLQERIAGIPGSVVFAADGRHATPLGLSRQLVGDARFGANGFRYCGSLLGPGLFPHQEELLALTAQLATSVTREFGLVGLNGIDFIARDGIPYPIEVNPRYCASMELIERGQGISIFEVHAQACQGILPAPAPTATEVQGKAIVFARRAVTMGDTRRWVGNGSLADVPQPGERIRRGHPICTVFAQGSNVVACRTRLVTRAARIYRASESRKRRAA